MKALHRLLARPDLLFLALAIPFGLAIAFLLPPLGGSDEDSHYHRIASVAYGTIFNAPVSVPSGIPTFLTREMDFFFHVTKVPYGYPAQLWHEVAAIPLAADRPESMQPTPVTIHHPFSYLPCIPALRIAAMLNMPPLGILYLLRLCGLAGSIALTWMAIRIAPSYRYLFCAIALLPTVTFYRSYINADSFTTALAFVFTAAVLREMQASGPLAPKRLGLLALTAFVLAQCKSTYLLLPLLACGIPAGRFSSAMARTLCLALIILPGALASMAWMLLIKASYFTDGMHYVTWGGAADPDKQIAFILHNPFAFLRIVGHTLFLTNLLPDALEGMLAEVGHGYGLPLPVTALLCYGLAKTAWREKQENTIPYGNRFTRLLAAGIFMGVILLSLMVLYIQWTGVEAPAIKGFQGRYLHPLLPYIVFFLAPATTRQVSGKAAPFTLLTGLAGLSATVVRIHLNYY